MRKMALVQDDPVLQLLADNNVGNNSNLVFSMKFPDNSFKALATLLKEHAGALKTGNFCFFQQGVTYQRWDDGESVFNYAELHGEEMCGYNYRSCDDIDPREVRHMVGVSFIDLCGRIKGSKNDGVMIYKIRNNPCIHVKTIDGTGDNNNIRTVTPRTLKQENYNIDNIEQEFCFSTIPDVKVTTVAFKNMITIMNTIGSSSIKITRHERGVMCYGIGPDNNVMSVQPWFDDCEVNAVEKAVSEVSDSALSFLDDIDDSFLSTTSQNAIVSYVEDDQDYQVKVVARSLKSFAKFHTICPIGIVKIYMGRDAVKFEGSIGTYGTLTTIVRSNCTK